MDAATGYTRVPHWIIDGAAEPDRPHSVTVLLLVLARHTVGWQRDEVTLSVPRLADLCGLSLQGVRKAISHALARGLIAREPAGNAGHVYRLGGSTQCTPLSVGDQLSVPQGINSVHPLERRGSTECTPGDQLSVPQGINLVDPYKDNRKIDLKDKSEGVLVCEGVSAACASPHAGRAQTSEPEEQPARTRTPQQPARTPTPHVAPAPPPPLDPAQPRLVESVDADPLAVYREVCQVRKPNQAQRAAIAARVTGHPDLWRETCDRFARNGWNVRAVDNLLDAYDKAIVERRRIEAAAAAREDEARRDREAPRLTPEQREANLRRLAEFGKALGARADDERRPSLWRTS